jgi:hypothetical protein
MGAELSRPAVESGVKLPPTPGGLRRVGSSSALDAARKKPSSDLPTSASTTSLATMVPPAGGYTSFSDMKNSASDPSTSVASTPRDARGSVNSTSSSGSKGGKLFGSIRRSRNSRGVNLADSQGGSAGNASAEDHTVESLDLPMVEWEGYATKRGHLVRNWKMRFFTLEGNLVSCELAFHARRRQGIYPSV